MRTVETKVYTFDELSQDAQSKVMCNFFDSKIKNQDCTYSFLEYCEKNGGEFFECGDFYTGET